MPVVVRMSGVFHGGRVLGGVASIRVLILFGSLSVAGSLESWSAVTCPAKVTGCTYAERPYALCEGYDGWLASIAGMRGKTFCVVNEDQLDADTKLHFRRNCARFTPCEALPPGSATKKGKKPKSVGKAKPPPIPQAVAGPFLVKPACPIDSVPYEGVRQYTSGPNAGKKVPVWYCFKKTK